MSFKLLIFTLSLLPLVALADEESATEKPDLAKIMAKYFAAQGGLEYIETIDSIRMDGTIYQDGDELSFVQVKKRPDLLRMTIDYGRTDIIMGYNGIVAWQTARGREQSLALEGEARVSFLRNTAMFSQLYQPNDPNVVLDYIGDDVWEGKPVHKIEVTLADGYKMLYYVDTKKYVDLLVVTIGEKDGVEHVIRTIFSDYRKLDKLNLPYSVTSYIDNELSSKVTLDHIRLNPGVFTPYFDPPGGIEGVDTPVTAREVAAQEAKNSGDQTEVKVTEEPKTIIPKATGRTITSTSK